MQSNGDSLISFYPFVLSVWGHHSVFIKVIIILKAS